MLAIAQQVIHQQFFGERLQRLGQLSEKHSEVFQDLLPRQRLAWRFGADSGAIDQIQTIALAEQVVQVQVFLPQAFAVHLADRAQGFRQHRRLLIGQHRQVIDLLPGITEAGGVFQKLEQQPTALAVLEPISQQQRCGQALRRQQAHAIQLPLKMPRRFGADQQFGQHRTTTPDTGPDISLSGQHAQQTQQLQIRRPGSIGQ
ncbi:hypothetical protein D3C72_1114860 [compost metagenome]